MPRLLPRLPLLFSAFALSFQLFSAAHAECRGESILGDLPPEKLAAIQAATDAVPYATGNFWRATRGDQVITIAGTYHLDDPRHAAFTAEVKLEPFARALRETAPKVWFTALRATDTAVRAQMDPVSVNPDGLIKVAPLLHWSSKDLHEYCVQHGLPNNFDYVDPTKGEDNRECGLHLAH